jgi:hypothetical protein
VWREQSGKPEKGAVASAEGERRNVGMRKMELYFS